MGLVTVGVLGMTDTLSMVMRSTIVQLTTPDKLLGRASSIGSFVAMGANNLGQVEVGLLSAAIGAGNTMGFGGVLCIGRLDLSPQARDEALKLSCGVSPQRKPWASFRHQIWHR
jgi:hypothetical protein